MGVAAAMPSPRSFVAEFGSRDVNGSARELILADHWYGVDLVEGPGVDEVCPAELWASNPGPAPDTILCLEVLEHTPEGAAIVRNAYRQLRAGGVFIVTAASPRRTPHGADGSRLPGPQEHYQGVDVLQLGRWLHVAGFDQAWVGLGGADQGDVYALGVRFPQPHLLPAPPPPLRGGPPNVRARMRAWRR